MNGVVEGIFVTAEGSAAMERVDEVHTVEGCGIEGDRYCEGTGFWTRYGDVCQVTLIEGEDLGNAIEMLIDNPSIDHLHVHNASRGCWAALVERG